MNSHYSNEPITFENIVSNRPANEVVENTTLLISFFYDNGFDTTEKYLEHNNIDLDEDLIYTGIVSGLGTFFTKEKETKLQNFIEEFRQSKFEENDDNVEDLQFNSEVINEEPNYIDGICHCNSCNLFNKSEEILKNFNPQNNAELIIFNALDPENTMDFIRGVYLNPDLN